MNGVDQVFVFLVSVCCGAAGGLLYDGICALRTPFAHRAVTIVTDILFCVAFAAFYLAVCTALALPGLRFYSFVACALGFCLYLKSLHKIVAFFAKKIYNGLRQKRRGRIACPEKEARDLPKKR